MAKRELEFTTRLTREDVAGLVEAMVEGLKDGCLKVQKSNEYLELQVPRVVDLKIEAEIDDERAEFEIEVSWRTNRAENPDLAPEGLPLTPGDKAGDNTSLAEEAKKTSVASARAPAAKQTPAKKAVVKKPVAKKPAAKKPAAKNEDEQ